MTEQSAPTAPESAPPAPFATADLLLAFVNTQSQPGRARDLLDDRTALSEWLASYAMDDDAMIVTDADAAATRELRGAFTIVFRSHVGCEQGAELLGEAEHLLRSYGQRYPLTPVIDSNGCTFRPSHTGIVGAFEALLAAAVDLAARDAWPRMKMCSSSSCYRGFYDRTRNSSGRYCSTRCSQQAATHAYRDRQKKNCATKPTPAA
ncbi:MULTISPECIES: ABATE domain-containing protein [unclassified Streptomyces]|uniref:ABATE domain-containing protein n=1 Tax=unclassified Streptomyces TaxID=2593676 RepID=UPI0036328ADF